MERDMSLQQKANTFNLLTLRVRFRVDLHYGWISYDGYRVYVLILTDKRTGEKQNYLNISIPEMLYIACEEQCLYVHRPLEGF